MSLLLSALKDAEGRKRAQQVPAATLAPEPAPAPDAGEIAALLSSREEDTLLSLEEDVVAPTLEPALRATLGAELAPTPTPTPTPPAAAAAQRPPSTPQPSAFAGLPTPQDILRARAERAAPAQAAQGSSVAAARATRGTSATRSGSGASAPEAGLDALLKRVMAHLPAQFRQHPLPMAGAAVAVVLLVGWFVLGGSSTGVGDAPLTLGPSLPAVTIGEAPAEPVADTAAGPQGPDDVALPTPEAPAGAGAAADAPIALAGLVRQPAPTPGPAPHSATPAAPAVPYTGAGIKPRLEIAGRPSPLPAAYAALRAGDLAMAERLYAETLAGEPDQPDAHLGLAALAQGRGDDAAAVRHYRAVLETVPDHPRAWAGLAALAGSGELEPMESKLRGLIAARPAPALHFALGNVLARQGRWAEAQQGFFAASAADPQNADYAFNLAVSLERIGKASAASPHYARAAALAEAGAPAQFQSAVARQRLAELQPGTP